MYPRSLLGLFLWAFFPDAEERFLLVERRLRDIVVRALRSSALLSFVVGLEALLEGFAKVKRTPNAITEVSPSIESSGVVAQGVSNPCHLRVCRGRKSSPAARVGLLENGGGVVVVCGWLKAFKERWRHTYIECLLGICIVL